MKKNRVGTAMAGILCLVAHASLSWASAGFGPGQSLDVKDFLTQARATGVPAESKRGEAAVVGARTLYKASLKGLLAKQTCSSQFQQVNGREPLATCAVDAGLPGVIKPVAILPFGLHGEFDSEIGAGSKAGCTGGIRGDAGQAGHFQIFAGLSPWSLDYSKAQFQECFESVIAKLQAKDRVMYFEVVQAAK